MTTIQATHHAPDAPRITDSLVLAVCGPPGCGKTTLIEQTVRQIVGRTRCGVVLANPDGQGDLRRLRDAGASVLAVQADMLQPRESSWALHKLAKHGSNVLFIEQPAGAPDPVTNQPHLKVAIFSVTGGDDKPLKFPRAVEGADLVLLNKVDLLLHVNFSRTLFENEIHQLAPNARVIELSATDAESLHPWLAWLNEHLGAIDSHPCDLSDSGLFFG